MAKNPDSGRNKDTQANRYHDPAAAKRKRAARKALDDRFNDLAGEVTVRNAEEDGAPCCPDPGCSGNPCTFPGYARSH